MGHGVALAQTLEPLALVQGVPHEADEVVRQHVQADDENEGHADGGVPSATRSVDKRARV